MKVVDKRDGGLPLILTAFLRTCWSFRVADSIVCSIVALIVEVWLLLGSVFLRL